MIQFVLNRQLVQLTDVAAETSVLQYLRDQQALSGTKEGCGSGDCGACTVVIGEHSDNAWAYKSANACLTMVSALHGCHVMTVEALTPSSLREQSLQDLHPVQRAMVECHGSQCGFCTPGFIMSLYVLYLNHLEYPGRDAVIHALGGNLCRCTGYRPILEAAERAYSFPREETNLDMTVLAQLRDAIKAQPDSGQIQSSKNPHSCNIVVKDLAQLLAYNAAEPEAKIVAGGTDLSLEYSQFLKTASLMLDISQCKELLSYDESDDAIHIGAALPYSDFLPAFLQHFPQSEEVFLRLGSEQVRNRGTMGGSLANASAIGDPAPLMVALNATMTLAGTTGEREVKVADFFTAYRQTLLASDEVVKTIHVPKLNANQSLVFYKISKRMEDDISALCLAMVTTVDNGVVTAVSTGFGGMSAFPHAATAFEAALTGKAYTLENLQVAAAALAQDFSPMSDVRASADYRNAVAKNLIERSWYESSLNTTDKPVVRVHHA